MTRGYYDGETGLAKVDYTGDRPRMVPVELTARDEEILATRRAALDAIEGPRVGDYVVFADGESRRFAYDWDESGIQTCKGGSFYLGNGYVSMSGGLEPPIPHDTLRRTEETRDGAVWFFHDDWHKAHNAVNVLIPFRVYTCTLTSTERVG